MQCPYCELTYSARIVEPREARKAKRKGRILPPKIVSLSKDDSLTYKCFGCGKFVIARRKKK